MNYFKCKSVRLCRFLYSLGFDKQSVIENGIEYWLFEKSDMLQEALDFFFAFREKQELTKNETGKIRFRDS